MAHDFMFKFNSNMVLSRLVFRNIGDTYFMYPRPRQTFCPAEALCFRYVRPSVRAFFLARLAEAFFERFAVDFYFILEYVFVMTARGRTITLTGVFDFFAAFSAIAELLAVFCYR